MNKKFRISLVIIMIMLVCTIFVATSYALWTINKVQEDTNVIATGCFNASLTTSNPIALTNAYPIKEGDGLKSTPYTFTITNTCTIDASYEINLESLGETTLGNEYLRVSLNKQMSSLYSSLKDATKFLDSSKTAKNLTKGSLPAGKSVSYDLRLWLDYDATLNTTANKTFAAKIIVLNTATEYETLADKVELGDYIRMTPTSTSYTPPSELTGCMNDANCTQGTLNPSELNLWRVIRKNDNGTVDVVSEYVSSTNVYFRGREGVLNYVGTLNTIAAQYTNEKYIQSTRYFGYNNQIEICTDLTEISCPADLGYETDANLIQQISNVNLAGVDKKGESKNYWIASRTYIPETMKFGGKFMGADGPEHYWSLVIGEYTSTKAEAIRPILTLKSNIEPISGDGKSADTAYTFE